MQPGQKIINRHQDLKSSSSSKYYESEPILILSIQKTKRAEKNTARSDSKHSSSFFSSKGDIENLQLDIQSTDIGELK